jgi:hypothetical protein
MPSPPNSNAIIERLNTLKDKLSAGDDRDARNEAVMLSRILTLTLSEPLDIALEVTITVSIQFK